MVKKYLSLSLMFCFFTGFGFAQNTNTGNWMLYLGNQKITNKINWHNEVQYRNYNFIGDLKQLVFRTGIGYNLTENNNNILLGYGFINSQDYLPNSNEKVSSNEHRIFQQFITRQNIAPLQLQNRFRIEERFLSNNFKLRLRYLLGVNIPFNNTTLIKNTVYLSAYNEVFLNTKNSIFDRNRLYGALGYVINNTLKIEVGFMAQTLEKSNRNQFQLVFYNNLPFNGN